MSKKNRFLVMAWPIKFWVCRRETEEKRNIRSAATGGTLVKRKLFSKESQLITFAFLIAYPTALLTIFPTFLYRIFDKTLFSLIL